VRESKTDAGVRKVDLTSMLLGELNRVREVETSELARGQLGGDEVAALDRPSEPGVRVSVFAQLDPLSGAGRPGQPTDRNTSPSAGPFQRSRALLAREVSPVAR
jgi:hypothetical protein